MLALINLDDAAQRRSFMQAQLDGLGLPFQRIGVDFRKWPAGNIRAWVASRFPWLDFDLARLSGAEVGCWASHVLAWQRLHDAPHLAAATVIEDDVVLAPDFAAAIGTLARRPRHDLVYLGTSSRNISQRRRVHNGGHAVHAPVGVILNTWGYVISRAWVERFFGARSIRIAVGIDEFLGGRARVLSPQIGVLRPPVVDEHVPLGIASQIEPYTSRFDRSPLFDRTRRRFLRSRAGDLYYATVYRWL